MPVLIETFLSERLNGNPLGDSPARRVPVYLPQAASADPEARFPVLFALAGFTGTGQSFLNYNFYSPSLPELLDTLIGSGEMAPCVVVMVDAMTALGGNQYLDSPAVGPWASHIVEELVPWVEARFPVLPGRAHRGVFGHSSGGYGALMMGLKHADVFAAVASHAGDCYFDYCYVADFPAAINALRRVGGVERFLATWRHHDQLPGYLFPLLSVIAMSAFYSPSDSSPYGFDLPFDPETGELNAAVFERWRAFDPVNLVATHAEALKSLSLLFFDCGERDEYHLQHGARILASRLKRAEIPFEYETFEDGHRGTSYRYRASLPKLARALSR